MRRQKGGLKCAITSRIDLFGGWGLFTGACPSNDLRFPGWIFLFLPTTDAAPYLPGDAWFILQRRPLGLFSLYASFQGECVKLRIGSYFLTTTVIWILMCHILKKNDNLTCKVWGKISDGHVALSTHVHQWLNWSPVCMGTCNSAGRLVCIQTCTRRHTLNIFFQQQRNPSWNIPVTGPIELLTRVSLLNHSCWDSKPISRASLQASDSSARYPVVPLLCWPSDGRMGNKNREAEMPLVWLFKASSPVCYAQRATSAAGLSQRRALGSLCGCVHCRGTTKRF